MVLGVLLKRAAILLAILLLAGLWTSCNNNYNYGYTNNLTLSQIKDAALFDNTYDGAVNILDIDLSPPQLYQTTLASLTFPEQMLMAPDKSFVLIYDDSAYTLSIYNVSQAMVTGTLNLNYHSDSIVLASDGKHAYAAVPNNPELNAPPGAVLSFDLTTGSSGAQIAVPGARRIALSGDGKSLLVFADNDNNVYYVDLTATTLAPVAIAGFNQPYTAYFASDNTTAYVLNCGTECTGSAPPSVQAVSVTPKTQTLGKSVAVPGATVGILDGTTLYVAGNDLTQASGSQGVFSVVDLSGMAVTNTAPISDGLHLHMAFFDNKYWVGSWNCSTTNCLSVYDTSSKKATVGTSVGNVTALTPAPVKNWMYVVEGGQMYQYDPSTLNQKIPYTITGQGWDVKLLNQ